MFLLNNFVYAGRVHECEQHTCKTIICPRGGQQPHRSEQCNCQEYELHEEWGTYGKPEHLFTDGGKDFRSNHLNQIAVQLGFVCHLRDRPSEGGIVERPFKTFNTDFFSTLPGYTSSNVQERPESAEKEAMLTLRDLEQRLVRYIFDILLLFQNHS